jgi:RNA polymerase sigma-70 factor (ECF subfamily)
LRICLEQLDEPKRRAILLCYVTGLNHGEAAATMQAPLGTVKAWIRRGVFALQECLS